MVRLAAYGGLSCAAAAYVVLSAFRQRSNFFAAAVYLSKSNASMMLLWNFGIFLTIIFGRGVQTVFFGPLRLVEVERMHERVWYAITESLLALTIFRESFDTAFVILFVSLLFLKVFHWLASDRVEMMEQAPVIPRLFHIRMVAMLSILWVVDTVLVAVAADSILTEGPSVMIMFASEYMILLATLLGTSLKYGGNAYDLRNDVPWENKSVFIFYVELACDFLKLATYLCFFSLILTFYGLPLNILRDVYMTARSFINKIRDLSRYRQATRNMDQRYPNATADEMERLSDKICIICREDMEARAEAQNQARDTRQGPNDTPKKLPCGHIFHFHCLRSWLERQQSCPTCRRPVLASSSSTARQPAAPPQPAPAQQPALAQAAALPQANRPQQTGAPSTSAEASAASRSPTPANAQLSVPTSTTPRPIAGVPSSSSRRRAGSENPLVAFQLRSAPKPPLVDIAQPSQPGNATAVMRSSPTGSADAGSVANNENTDQSMKQKKPEASPSIGIGSSLDEQRKQRFEAALKRRGIAVSESSSSVRSSENGPQPLRSLTPTPTIKIDEVIAEPEKSASDGAQQTPQPATAVRAKAQPAAVQNILGQHATSLDSRASSPVTILDPMGAFGGSSLPTSSSSSSIPAWASPAVLTSSDPFAFSNTSQAAPSLPSLKSDDMPRLIPLFDPSDPSKPGYLARFLPSLAQSGFWPTSNDTTQEPVHQPEMGHLPEDLDEGQLAALAEVTREGLQTRLRLLNSTQTTLQTCIGQLQKAMKVLDTGDVQGVLRTVSEIENIPAEQTDQATSQASQACTQDKGKAREVPTAMATTINHD